MVVKRFQQVNRNVAQPHFRLDRQITQLLNRTGLSRRIFHGNGIPILMYHSISNTRSTERRPYFETTTTPDVFRQHMQYLTSSGFETLSLSKAIDVLFNGRSTEKKLVVITFDDGYKDFSSEAFPILQEYNLTATVFLMTRYVEKNGTRFKGKECLSWSDVDYLSKHDVEFGSHTVSHPELNSMDMREIEYEIAASREAIQDRIGINVSVFSYPYAFPEQDLLFRKKLMDLLVKHGYQGGVTTIIGTSSIHDNRFFLKRIPVNTYDDAQFFKSKLEGSYDWMHTLQLLLKRIKKPARNENRK